MFPFKIISFVFLLPLCVPPDLSARQSFQETDTALFEDQKILDASQCSHLFGNNQIHDNNRTARKENLVSIQRYAHATVIVHHTNWNKPRYIEYPGINLVDTISIPNQDTRRPVAYIEITEELGAIDCDPGIYAVDVDDSIGKKTKVLAILEDLVLIERDKQLLYLTNDPTLEKPLWQMVWASPWKIIKTQSSSGPGSVSPRTPSRHHRTPRKHSRAPNRARR